MDTSFDPDMATRRLGRELAGLSRSPAEGCSAGPSGESLLSWRAIVLGPKDSPYEHGVFTISLNFSPMYPLCPPKAIFHTKIYHPNISGCTLCLDLLKDGWDAATTVPDILKSIQNLLAHPDFDNPLDVNVAHVYRNHPDQFVATAREWVYKYAS